ncbi:MAG: OmpA family protein [Salibacteraceae bacterium]
MMAASGEHGYYASSALGGLGQRDLYLITFLGPEKQVMLNTEDNLLASRAEPVREVVIEPTVEVSTAKVTIFKGIVTDAATGEPIEARIEVYDNAQTTRELAGIASAASNSTSGKFLVPLPSGKNYGIAVKAPGYLFHSENFIIPESAAYKEVVKTIQLQRLEVGKAIVLKNIFFDSGKSDLRPESTIELTNVYELMKDNPTLKVEISGHTDNVGSNNANQSLSELRAQAVVNYLLELGITTDRMSFKGYGETAPIATNDTEEGRQENRRTEFKVLAK